MLEQLLHNLKMRKASGNCFHWPASSNYLPTTDLAGTVVIRGVLTPQDDATRNGHRRRSPGGVLPRAAQRPVPVDVRLICRAERFVKIRA